MSCKKQSKILEINGLSGFGIISKGKRFEYKVIVSINLGEAFVPWVTKDRKIWGSWEPGGITKIGHTWGARKATKKEKEIYPQINIDLE